jgi:hypothetical protein
LWWLRAIHYIKNSNGNLLEFKAKNEKKYIENRKNVSM